MTKEFEETKRKTILEMFKEIKDLEVADSPLMTVEDCLPFMCEKVEQALQRLDKYEQILGSGRLTDRNYKNTTLDLESCKPYVRLGQIEDIYEEGK